MGRDSHLRWSDMSAGRRGITIAMALVQVALATMAWRDLARRPRGYVPRTEVAVGNRHCCELYRALVLLPLGAYATEQSVGRPRFSCGLSAPEAVNALKLVALSPTSIQHAAVATSGFLFEVRPTAHQRKPADLAPQSRVPVDQRERRALPPSPPTQQALCWTPQCANGRTERPHSPS